MITAIVLAAGESRRMGRPKLALPWGKTTVLGQVLATYTHAGVDNLLVVTGGNRDQVEALIGDSARVVFNPDYARGEMLSSLQCGVRNLEPACKAILIALADQPLLRSDSVKAVIAAYQDSSQASIVVPSYQLRRGHPWLATAIHWDEILELRAPLSLRDFLRRHQEEIHYVTVDDPGVLQDLDTPDDYLKTRP